MIFDGAIPVDEQTAILIRKYGLVSDVQELYYRIMDQSVASQRVEAVSVTTDCAWNPSRPRVLMTIHFSGSLAQAVESWLAVYDRIIARVNPHALDEERLAFSFDATA